MPYELRSRSLCASTLSTVLFLSVSLLASAPARAEGDAAKPSDGAAKAEGDRGAQDPTKEEGTKEKGKEEAIEQPSTAATVESSSPYESPDKAYRFIGLRFRDVIVPKFMVNIFADGGATVNVPMIGPEFTTRKDHTEFDFAIQYADYSMNPFIFKGKKDGPDAYELVSSSLKMLLLSVDLLYDIPLDKSGRFSVLVGGGVGIGVVFGNLYRAQAYPANGGTDPDPDKPGDWQACTGPSASPVASNGVPYCDSDPNHARFGGYSEPGWANGGSKPLLFPWISLPQLSFRYKPIKQLQTRLDTGFSTSGFFLGLSAGYGL